MYGLQRSLDIMSEAYLRAGLIINTTKTEILSASSHDAPKERRLYFCVLSFVYVFVYCHLFIILCIFGYVF